MAKIIADQNRDIRQAWNQYSGSEPTTNFMLMQVLGLSQVDGYFQDYATADLKVKVI
jgi:hypothetical protein